MTVDGEKDHDYENDNKSCLTMSDKISPSGEDSLEKSATMTPPSIGDDQLPVNNPDHPSHESHEDSDGKDVETDGSPLDRTHSQAQKLGKKKILIIMPALCVCFRHWDWYRTVLTISSWCCFWPLWIWYVLLTLIDFFQARLTCLDNRLNGSSNHGCPVSRLRKWLFMDGFLVFARQCCLYHTLGQDQ